MGWMKKGLMIGGVGAMVMLTGCGNSQQQRSSSASGSLALSTDDSLLYAADTDNGVLSVIDTKTDTKKYDVKVGARPMRVAVGADDTVYVANRGSRSVSVIRSGEQAVSTEIATGVDPTGLAVSFDGKTLYVVSATAKDTTDYGILQAIDTATLEVKYEKPIGYEPRSIALVTNDKALVTQYRGANTGADVVEVNLQTGEVMNGGSTGLYDSANKSRVDNPTAIGAGSTFKARAMTDVVVTPDGTRAFVPTVWAREDAIGRRPSTSGGYYSSGGPCNVGAVATAGIVTMDTGANGATSPRTDDLTSCSTLGTQNNDVDYPPTAMGTGGISTVTAPGTSTVAVQGPSAAAVDPTGEWLFVVNKETSNVAVMPATRRQSRDGENNDVNVTGTSFRSVVGVNNNPALNSGPDGIALTKDGRRAYVYNQFDHQVVRLGNEQGGPKSEVTVMKTIDLGLPEKLSPDEVKGRRFFFDAQSTKMSSSTTHVACSTCHLEGRDDGHVWSFPDGLRQTPTLVGRSTTKTLPMHWNGEHRDFTAFMTHTVVSRMGGSGSDAELNRQMEAWLNVEPAPENANLRSALSDAQLRGQAAYAKAQCNTCHSGEYLTNGTLQDVGTGDAAGTRLFDTPSLKGLARSAPYMHDGKAATLIDRLQLGGNVHGRLDLLTTEQEKLDLVEYLKTL